MSRPEVCRRCRARARRTGERRQRCRACRDAWTAFQRAARELLELRAEEGRVVVAVPSRGYLVASSPDVAPLAEPFRWWLHASGDPSAPLVLLQHDPLGKVSSFRPWA